MRRIPICIALALGGVLLFGPPVSVAAAQQPNSGQSADSGPSLQVTLDWLKDKIKNNGGGSRCQDPGQLAHASNECGSTSTFDTVRLNPVDFSGCRVTWVLTEHNARPDGTWGWTKTQTITVPLYESFGYFPFGPEAQNVGSLVIGPDQTGGWWAYLQLKDPDSHDILVQTKTTSDDTGMPLGGAEPPFERVPWVALEFALPDQDNEDMARRVATAFSHAIQLCQSQKPQKPVNNEPF